MRGEVLFFNASWCGPCRQMKPIVSDLRREGFDCATSTSTRTRTWPRSTGRSVPTFVFVENGSEVRRFSGGTSADDLRKLCSPPGLSLSAVLRSGCPGTGRCQHLLTVRQASCP